MTALFRDRREAGQQLARRLEAYKDHSHTVVLGLPRGGMVPAFEVAHYLNLPLDLIMVRKLTLPGKSPRPIGAITSGGHTFLDEAAIGAYQVTEGQVHEAELDARSALQRREKAYRGNSPNFNVRDHSVIIVDDGMHSGATMQVAIAAVRNQGPTRIVVAVPVAPAHSLQALEYADEVICLQQPSDFQDLASCYEDFTRLDDDQVRDLLERSDNYSLNEVDIPPYT